MTLRALRSLASTASLLLTAVALIACDDGSEPGPNDGDAGDTGLGEGGAGGARNGGAAGDPNAAGAAGDSGEADDLLVDDFEDGDAEPLIVPGGWYSFTDSANEGGSTLQIGVEGSSQISMVGEGYESERSLLAEVTFDQGGYEYDPYVGFGAWLASEEAPLDLSGYRGIAYTYRGLAHTVRVETYDVTDYDVHGMAMTASSTWKTVEIPLRDLVQENWGIPVEFDPSNVGAISFHLRGTTGDSGSLEIDDLKVIAQLANDGPDMEVRDPAPPEQVEMESVAVENPLQALAMEHLSRGYNITNWLEQGRFESFDYDESFVESLADAGFRSLRLPIDLDLYIEEQTGSGEDMQLVLSDDLFLVLDSFEAWTAAHGLSLTIDYHQYDNSFDFDDPDSISQAVALWGLVAEHFAENEREDLFFELLNEPELSAAAEGPTQAEWTEIAEAMIAAIRVHDEQRIILFGDVEWYGITPLSQREPLSDPNVIYVFHFYDPFIFTHQGASWANMGSTHDLPYPYDPDRWSEYYSELGFNKAMESWILGQVRTYYRDGSREAIYNRIAQAKQWAVENDVPVICNEFGVYETRSQLEDKVRYYGDLIGVFDELEIPWQIWFMILSEDGTLIPEYREAFGLNGT